MPYTSIFVKFQYTPKRLLNIKCINATTHKTEKQALGYIYNIYGMVYCKKKGNVTIVCNFQFGWEPRYIDVCFVAKNHSVNFDLTDTFSKRRLTEILDHLILVNQQRDFGGHSSQYSDNSILMSRWSWEENIPKGYRLLNEGEVIEDTDMEYSETISRKVFWSSVVSWYNAGKKVEMSSGVSFHTDGKEVESIPGHPTPLICRRMKPIA